MLRAQSPKKTAALKAQAEAAVNERRDSISRRIATYAMERAVSTTARTPVLNIAKTVDHKRGEDSREAAPMNAAEKRWVDACCALGCVVCRHRLGLETAGTATVWHHLKHHELCGAGMRSPHVAGLSLCPAHHDGHGAGISYHSAPETWEAKFGTQLVLFVLQVEDVARSALR